MADPAVDFPKGIGAPATRALVGAGYSRLSQLAGVPFAELAKLHGMGPKALGIIEEALAQADPTTASDVISPDADIISKLSSRSVADTVSKLVELVEAKDMKVFEVIDHSGEAARSGLELRETKVVIFGSPVAGTPVMQAAPLAALDLPLKVLVWDDDGQTTVSYLDPAALARRHHLSAELAGRLAGIGPLTDALTV